MAKLAPYTVLVRDLPTHRRFEIPGARVAEWVRGLPMRDALGAPEDDPQAGHGAADLDLYADGSHVFAAGPFRGEVTVACSRCVEPVRIPIEEKLRVTFMPRHELPTEEDDEAAEAAGGPERSEHVRTAERPARRSMRGARPVDEDPEGPELAEEDLDLFPYDGDAIDLEPLFREQFVLAVPFAPLCREDCKGLCPQCGIDRNTGTCSCEPPIDPRLAALKGLKLPP